MKFFIAIVTVVVLMLSVSGCYELIATNDKTAITTGMDALMTRVDEFQNVFKKAAAANLIDAEETEKRNEQIDEIQEFVAMANESIKESPTLIEAAIKTNQASAVVNPYAGVIDAVLKIIAASGTAGVIGLGVKTVRDGRVKKGLVRDNIVMEDKYKATNRANEKLRMFHPEIAKEHYELVGKEKALVKAG